MTQIIFAILVKLSHSPMLLTTSNSRASTRGSIGGQDDQAEGARKYDFEKNIYFPLPRSAGSAFYLCCSARQSRKLLLRPPGFFLSRGLVFSFLLQQCRSHFIFLPHCTILVCCTACCNTCISFLFFIPQLLSSPPHWTHGQKQMGKHCLKRKKKTPGKKSYCYMCTVVPVSLHVV